MWPRDPANPRQPHVSTKEEGHVSVGYAAPAAGYLGRMYLRGEGVKQDAVMAKMWLERGAEYGDKESHNGLGIIWRDGLVDSRKDLKRAMGHFAAAATQELAEAQVNIGKYHYGRSHRIRLSLVACSPVHRARGLEARDRILRDRAAPGLTV